MERIGDYTLLEGLPTRLFHYPVQLAEEDELMWDDGSVNPEPCLDKFDLVTKVCFLSRTLEGLGSVEHHPAFRPCSARQCAHASVAT